MMTPDECRRRASLCAHNASVAESEAIALEFVTLAARWRVMACRGFSLSELDLAPCPTTSSQPSNVGS